MTFLRLAWVCGALVLAALCWLAAIGFTTIIAPLVTVVALVVLVGGGNWLSGRSPTAGRGSAPPSDPAGPRP